VDGDGVYEHSVSDCSSTSSFTYTYKQPGMYTATLRVEDPDRRVETRTLTVEVLPDARDLRVSVKGRGGVDVPSLNGTLFCTSLCVATIPRSSSTDLTLRPDPGWYIYSTQGCDYRSGNLCRLYSGETNAYVSAEFCPQEWSSWNPNLQAQCVRNGNQVQIRLTWSSPPGGERVAITRFPAYTSCPPPSQQIVTVQGTSYTDTPPSDFGKGYGAITYGIYRQKDACELSCCLSGCQGFVMVVYDRDC
jgi:hypothetical protein